MLQGTVLQELRVMNLSVETAHSVWRPLYNSVYNDALAICDPFSLSADKDLRAADRVSLEYVGEIQYVHQSPGQRWYSMSQQKPSEALLFTSFDSEENPYTACWSPFLSC